MEFIPFGASTNWPLAISISGVSLAVFIGAIALFVRNDTGKPKAKPGLRSVAIVAMIAGGMWIVFPLLYAAVTYAQPSLLSPEDTRNPAIRAQISSAYGLQLSDQEVSALGYPLSEPSSTSERFGSATVLVPNGDSFDQREVTLLWDGSVLILAESDDSGELKPLSPRR